MTTARFTQLMTEAVELPDGVAIRIEPSEVRWFIEALSARGLALEMVRDADNDCRRDGLPTLPSMPRAKIDAAIARGKPT